MNTNRTGGRASPNVSRHWWLGVRLAGLCLIAVGVCAYDIGAIPPEPNPPKPRLLLAQADKPATAPFFGGGLRPNPPESPRIGRRRVLSLLDARRAGVTLANVRQAKAELKASGEIDGDTSRAEIAVMIAEKLATANQQNSAALFENIDWEALFSLIERLLAIIERFFPQG